MSTVTDFLDHSNHTLLVIDGSSFLYRAYHGLPERAPQDRNTTGGFRGEVLTPSCKREMARKAKQINDVSQRFICQAFNLSQTAYRYISKRVSENDI